MSGLPGFNENHKRRILASFQHVDEMLTESLNVVNPAQSNLYSRFVKDLSDSDLDRIEGCAVRIREHMRELLERLQIELPVPSVPSSWLLKTCLTSLDITLEELYPEKMKGYGAMDQASAADMTRTLQEIRRLVGDMLAFLT